MSDGSSVSSRSRLDDARSHGDCCGDEVGVALSELQPVEPVGDLCRGHSPGEHREAETPVGHVDTELARELPSAVEERHGLVVRGEMRMDRAGGAELCEPRQRVSDLSLLEQRGQLVAQPGRREVSDEAHLDARPRQPRGVLVHAEAVPVLVADRPEDARRVLDEREVVQHAQRAAAARSSLPPNGSTSRPKSSPLRDAPLR